MSLCAFAALTLAAPSLAGCGADAEEPAGPTVTVRITRDYGHELLSEERVPLREGRTMLAALRYGHDVRAELSGHVMKAIDGLRPRIVDDVAKTTWIYTINGLESEEAPADYRLHAGDLVQWDLRPWIVTLDGRAMLGGFPHMLTRGVKGRPFRVTVHCQRPAAAACRRVGRTLERAGVAFDGDATSAKRPPAWRFPRARLLVGTWRHWRHLAWPERIDAANRYDGLYVRFADDGTTMQLLDWKGRIARTVRAGGGLLSAMSRKQGYVALLVGGTDAQGVARAARAFGSARLRGAYAAAVTDDGIDKLPLPPRCPSTSASTPCRPLAGAPGLAR